MRLNDWAWDQQEDMFVFDKLTRTAQANRKWKKKERKKSENKWGKVMK